ncbi:hypothetical protein SCHPADRAFT_927945 [Schizopora paradoxa]|uniref:Uncharacterized protein n=1 Tax=Schizopora paradoxa TaxID=27342 RepID=A0A0H2RQU1_9AGAM|nr:hypothetical protein SCHPADRAFT_927945 [Schizopora paradoxa]
MYSQSNTSSSLRSFSSAPTRQDHQNSILTALAGFHVLEYANAVTCRFRPTNTPLPLAQRCILQLTSRRSHPRTLRIFKTQLFGSLLNLWSQNKPNMRSRREKSTECEVGDSARGEYGPVISTTSLQVKRSILQIVPMISLLLAGSALMLAHHFFFAYLDAKIIDPVVSNLPAILQDQRTPYIIGTVLAHGARIVLSMAVNITFAQLFWETLRSRSHTVKQIDALVQCGHSPFSPSAFRAVTVAPLLLFLSVVASAMTLVVIVSPGSLKVSSDSQLPEPCLASTIGDIIDASSLQLELFYSVPATVLASRTYLPPSHSNICNENSSSCFYTVPFDGPMLECNDVSNRVDFSVFLNPPLDMNGQIITGPAWPFAVWNGSYFQNDDGEAGILVLTQDLLNGVLQANNCTMYRATYDVRVLTESRSTTVQVTNVTRGPPVNVSDGTFLSEYAVEGLTLLEGIVAVGPFGATRYGNNPPGQDLSMLANSGMFVVTPSGNHTFSDTPRNILTSYMQNLSISLLSGDIFNGLNDSAPLNASLVNSTCYTTWNTYVYSPIRLLSAYGAAIAVAIFVIAPGCSLALRNGSEGMVTPSDIILSELDPNSSVNGSIKSDTQVRVGRGARGNSARPAMTLIIEEQPQPKAIQKAAEILSDQASPKANILKRKLQASKSRIIAFSVAAICCVIANHLYFQFLDGRALNRLSGFLGLISDQSFVGYSGIALTFVVQASLGIVISTSSSQIFWRSLRSQGHSVSQTDALMNTRNNPFSLSLFRCGDASLSTIVASFISSAITLVSVFVPGSISLSFDRRQSKYCVVKTPRNLTSLSTSIDADYSTPIDTVFLSGNYLSPNIPCEVDAGTRCNFTVDFMGPGLSCSDVTASSNFTAFRTESNPFTNDFDGGAQLYNIWVGSAVYNETFPEPLNLSLQTWDMQRNVYQSISCTSVSRAYSVLISASQSSSTIEVINSEIMASLPMDTSPDASAAGLSDFPQVYLSTTVNTLLGSLYFFANGTIGGEMEFVALFAMLNTLSSEFVRDYKPQNVSWPNMTETVEKYAENVTLSILSGQIYALENLNGSELLEDFTTICDYTFTGYEYSPVRLFTTYGSAILLTIVCVIGGLRAIKKNGVDESMDFSRFLRAALNERMLNVRERIDMETRIKADDDKEGSFAPCIDSEI